MFGMYCRRTRIAVIYSLKEKNMANILPIMKKHIGAGSVIFSDSHPGYCNMNLGQSKLSPNGWYHMWTNHSHRMVHEKFPFNSTLNIERAWSDIKINCYSIPQAYTYDRIQEFCDMFLTRRRLISRRYIPEFTLKCLHMWYKKLYNTVQLPG